MIELFVEFPPEVDVEYIDKYSADFKKNSTNVFNLMHKALDFQKAKYAPASADAVREEHVLKMKVSPPIPEGATRKFIEESWLGTMKQNMNDIEKVGGKVTVIISE